MLAFSLTIRFMAFGLYFNLYVCIHVFYLVFITNIIYNVLLLEIVREASNLARTKFYCLRGKIVSNYIIPYARLPNRAVKLVCQISNSSIFVLSDSNFFCRQTLIPMINFSSQNKKQI